RRQTLTTLLFLIGALAATGARAGSYKVTFDDQKNYTPNITAPFLQVTGGNVIDNSYYYSFTATLIPTKQYATWWTPYNSSCKGCSANITLRSEERRVGKECKSWWWTWR